VRGGVLGGQGDTCNTHGVSVVGNQNRRDEMGQLGWQVKRYLNILGIGQRNVLQRVFYMGLKEKNHKTKTNYGVKEKEKRTRHKNPDNIK